MFWRWSRMDDIILIKLGGSCASSPDFPRWIQALEKSTGHVVIVPGGGPFANTVRRYQLRIGYDDEAAHHMAILAMEQFGRALVSLSQRMVPASTVAEIEATLEAGRIPVWMAAAAALSDPDIPQSWSVTSDSLAAWLASKLPGSRLLLVKQIEVPEGASLETMSRAELIDEYFLSVLSPSTSVHVAGPSDLALAGRRLSEGQMPGHFVPARDIALHAAE